MEKGDERSDKMEALQLKLSQLEESLETIRAPSCACKKTSNMTSLLIKALNWTPTMLLFIGVSNCILVKSVVNKSI